MENRDSKSGTNKSASLLFSTAALMALLATFFTPATAQSLDGFWQSDGYGLLVEIRGGKMSVSQITSISCLPWWTAKRSDSSGSKSEVVFKRGNAVIRLTPVRHPDMLLMRESVSISSMELRRVNDRPKNCTETLADTPQNNYAVFWQTFAEQFALFLLYHTDWDAIDRKYRPRVTASTTPEELFGILREMILPFHNAHTNINAASINRQYVGYRPASEIGLRLQATSSLSLKEILDLFNQEAKRTKDIIESKYSDAKLRPLEAALDDIFKDAQQMKGLIIDVRINTGGADPYCLAIASRLTSAKYLAYSKVTRNNLSGRLHFTASQPAWVEVSTRPGYRGNVVLLVGPDTLSGGETFAMALMGRRPKVSAIGENTQGVFSDVFGHKLPNGWTFGLPNELYLTKSGKSFDGQGVPPNIRVPVYPKVDLQSSRDSALERALAVLGRH